MTSNSLAATRPVLRPWQQAYHAAMERLGVDQLPLDLIQKGEIASHIPILPDFPRFSSALLPRMGGDSRFLRLWWSPQDPTELSPADIASTHPELWAWYSVRTTSPPPREESQSRLFPPRRQEATANSHGTGLPPVCTVLLPLAQVSQVGRRAQRYPCLSSLRRIVVGWDDQFAAYDVVSQLHHLVDGILRHL